MFFIIYLLILALGLCIGSFLNCVIYRLEKNVSFVKGRSYCPNCKHQLIWLDLVPVFSFLFLGGKCRYCRQKISIEYPIVEIVTSLLFLLIFKYQFSSINFEGIITILFWWYVASSLVVIFVYDLKYCLIPDSVLFPAIAITFLYQLFFHFHLLLNYGLATVIAPGFFLAIFLVSKGKWMGFGDVKLAILLGLLLGFPNILVGLFLAFFFGAIIGVLLLWLNKKGLKSEIPFAPFLILGTFVALFWGEQIIHWYTHFLIF